MQALAMCQKVCPDKIPVVPTSLLGDGADGQVFDIEGEPDKVIKFCIKYDRGDSDIFVDYSNINKCLKYLETVQPSTCARVYDHSFLGRDERDTVSGKQNFILYYYTMEKLNKISEDEKKVFHSLLSHEDMNRIKSFSREKAIDMLNGMRLGLEFNMDDVLRFYDNLRNCKFKHNDIHVRNIMKDRKGHFKLIDFDRMEIMKDEQ